MLPVELEPEVPCDPDQPPDAVQEVALVDDQFNVALPPLATLVGLALKVTVGAGAGADPDTETVADFEAVPPPPLQVNT